MSVNETFMKTFGTVDVDGVGPIHIVSYSTDNLKVKFDLIFRVDS